MNISESGLSLPNNPPMRQRSQLPMRRRSQLPRLVAVAVTVAAMYLSGIGIPALAQTSSDVDHAAADRDAAYADLLKVEGELSQALFRYEEVHSQLEDLEDKVGLTERQLATYLLQVDDLDGMAKSALVNAYIGGDVSDLNISLSTKTFQDSLMARFLGQTLQATQQADLNRLIVVAREVERLQASLESDRVEMAQFADEAQQAAETVQTRLDSAEHELQDAEKRFTGITAKFEAAQQRKREAELARIRASKNQSVRGLPPAATPGFVCPVQSGAKFINSWGFPRSGGRTHKGVDMFAKRGTPTPAVTTGTVKLRTVNLGGTVTYLYGDDGNKYYYAHLNGYPDGLRDGQRVDRGQAIGYVGNSGNAEGTSPHLHFEIRPGGTNAVNPYPTVRPACP